ncbi:MAG: hypothetical protein IKS49_00175 [Actinomycetaceae bacterium]|nr:hypothetical protein [Actinomycetaceae bacterium]
MSSFMTQTARRPRLFLALFLLLVTALITITPLPSYAQETTVAVTTPQTAVTLPRETEENTRDGHVVLIMTSALQWEELDSYNAPRLSELAASGAMGNMVPLVVRGANCPLNSWLTLSAGTRTGNRSLSRTARCEVPPVVSGTQIGRYTCVRVVSSLKLVLFHHTNIEGYGAFSQALAQGDVTSYGIGTGAGYVLTTTSNTYPYRWESAPDDNAQLGERVAVSAQNYNLTVVDADTARTFTSREYPDFPEGTNIKKARKDYREKFFLQQAQGNAERIEAILERIPDGTRVVVVSLLNRRGTHSQMTVIGDIGDTSPAFEPVVPGLLYSASVRREGALQLTDIDPTILSWFSLARPEEMSGASLVDNPVPDSEACSPDHECFTGRLNTLIDDSSLFTLVRDIRHPFLSIFYYIAAFFFLVTILVTAKPIWQRSLGRRAWWRVAWMWLGYILAAFPLSAILVNLYGWWRSSSPLAVYASLSWLCAALFGLLALASRRLHRLAPLFVILVPTALFILVDTANGSRAMADSAIGFNTLAAARFYGLGNEPYALLAASSLFVLSFLGVWLRERLASAGKSRFIARAVAVVVVGLAGFVVVAIDALPRYGADFGGALSYLPALLVLLVLLSEAKVSWRGAGLIAGVTVAFAALIAFADWLRPPSSRTHLGNFFQSILDGNFFSVVGSKLETNLRLLTTSNYTFIVLRGILLLLIVLLPALAFPSLFGASRLPQLRRSGLESELSDTPLLAVRGVSGSERRGDLTTTQPASIWLRLKTRIQTIAQKIVALHERYWSWLFPRTEEEAASKRWPALTIALIVEVVVFVLSFAVNDSGVVLPAMAMLLLLPMLTSVVIDGLSSVSTEEKEAQNITPDL